MPVKRVCSKTTLLAAVTRLTTHLLAHHVTQHHQALFGAPFFRFVKVVIHQLVEHAHRRMAL